MAYLRDRQRVELMIPPQLLSALVFADPCPIAANPDHEDQEAAQREVFEKVERLRALLATAIQEPMLSMPPKGARKLLAACTRACETVIAEVLEGQESVKVAMTLYYVLQEHLLEPGIIELAEGSAFAEAVLDMMPMFEHGFEEERRDASARKQARRIMRILQRLGYFPGATIEAEAA